MWLIFMVNLCKYTSPTDAMGCAIRFHTGCFWSQGFIHSFTGKFWRHVSRNQTKGCPNDLWIIKPGASYVRKSPKRLELKNGWPVIGRYVMSRRAMGHGKKSQPDEGVELKVNHLWTKIKEQIYSWMVFELLFFSNRYKYAFVSET